MEGWGDGGTGEWGVGGLGGWRIGGMGEWGDATHRSHRSKHETGSAITPTIIPPLSYHYPTIILTWELLGITMELLGMLGIGGTRWGHVWDTFGTRLGCLMLRVVGRMLRVQGLVSASLSLWGHA